MTDRDRMGDDFVRRVEQWAEQEQTPPRPKRPRVYFLQERGGAIKIGFTESSVRDRVADLQSGNPRPLRVLAEIQGGREEEGRWHERFDHLRIGGEWFEAAPELLEAIEAASGGCRDGSLLTEEQVARRLRVPRHTAKDVMDRLGCVRYGSVRRLKKGVLLDWIDAGGDPA